MSVKVLIVEDVPATRELLVAAAQAAGPIDVYTATSGFEALKVLPRHQFALIITDIHLPDINGLELINFVKKNPYYRDTPLIVLTTEGHEQDRVRGLQLGANEYLVKPCAPQVMTALVQRYLEL